MTPAEDPNAEPEACQNCGALLFDDMEGQDDSCSAPYVTESGDLYCIRCGSRHDEAQRKYDEETAVDWMDDPYECSPPSDATVDRTGEPLDSCQHDLQLPECTVKVTDKGTRATCSECREVWLMPAPDRKGEA